MEFISKYDTTFIKFLNRKYGKKFRTFDEYSLYLYDKSDGELDYYYRLEDDIKEYCEFQQERKYGDGKSKN